MEAAFTKKEKLVGLFLLVLIILTKITLLAIAQGKRWFAIPNHVLHQLQTRL